MAIRGHTLQRRLLPSLLLLVVVVAAIVARPPGIHGHGIGTPRLINAEAGPYAVSIWSDPDPLRIDEAHVVVAVLDPGTLAPLVEDLTVTVSLWQSNGGSPVERPATADDSTNRLLYAAVFDDALHEGDWEGTVKVDGPIGSGQSPEFQLPLTSGSAPNWLLLGVGGVALLVVLWLLSGRRSSGDN